MNIALHSDLYDGCTRALTLIVPFWFQPNSFWRRACKSTFANGAAPTSFCLTLWWSMSSMRQWPILPSSSAGTHSEKFFLFLFCCRTVCLIDQHSKPPLTFSKVFSIWILHCIFTRTLAFENLCPGGQHCLFRLFLSYFLLLRMCASEVNTVFDVSFF